MPPLPLRFTPRGISAALLAAPFSGASCLLSAEGVFTAVPSWVTFQDSVDRRLAPGMVDGALVLSRPW